MNTWDCFQTLFSNSKIEAFSANKYAEMLSYDQVRQSLVNTLATGYGDFRSSVASGRRRATEISVFKYGWMEEGLVLLCVWLLLLHNHKISLEKVCRCP